jgi:hypothetical protein
MRNVVLKIIIFFSFLQIARASDTALTAEDIINKSIEFCGGNENIKKIASTELTYKLIDADSSIASVIIKRKQASRYLRSVLSTSHTPQTLYFDGAKVSFVEDLKIQHNDKLEEIEEVRLQTFDVIQYGYKELGYKFDRLNDQKFSHYDCLVVRATAKNGYSTLNYFDKTNFRLLMLVYPTGSKSVLTDFTFRDSVLFNTGIINVDKDLKQQILELQNIEINRPINTSWFTPPFKDKISIPEFIRTGNFKPVFGTPGLLTRNSFSQTETYNEGKSEFNLQVEWNNDYILSLTNSESVNTTGNVKTGDKILVKFLSWDENGYVCHYFSKGNGGTQEYIKVK